MASLSMRSSRESSRAVAVTIRTICPARQDSPKKAPPFKQRNDGFFALLRDHSQLDLALLNMEGCITHLALRKDSVSPAERQHSGSFA